MEGLAHRVREAAGEPAGALVLLHGRGADESDLFPVLEMLDPERRMIGVCPRGPLALPPGGAHWYRVVQVGFPDPGTFMPTFAALSSWLDGWLSGRGIGYDRVVLGGFSQGAVMSYSLALGPGRPRPAGLMAFSGFMPTVEGFELDLAGLEGWPVAIGHGTYDPVITVDWGRRARAALEAAGASVSFRESPMDHTIDGRWLAELRSWLPV